MPDTLSQEINNFELLNSFIIKRDIFDKNLQLDNIVNINCSMWHDEDLDLFESLQNQQNIFHS